MGKLEAKTEKKLDWYIDEYMYACKANDLRKKTLSSYEQTLRLFERWLKDTLNMDAAEQIDERVLRQYIVDLRERGKYTFYADDAPKQINFPERRRDFRQPITATTVNNYIRNLRAFFNWLEVEQEIYTRKSNPMRHIRQIPNERKARDYMEDSEFVRLTKNFDKSYFSEHRDLAIITLLMDSGMRIGECLSLELRSINFDERSIGLEADITKGRKYRVVFFSKLTSAVLKQWIQFKDRYCESNLLFCTKSGTPLSVSNFETNFQKYLARCGIDKNYTPHAIRNNFARRCLVDGMDIYTLSRILGHSSPDVTAKAYADLNTNDFRRIYNRHSPLENMKRG